MELSKKAGVLARPRASADYNYLEGVLTSANRTVAESWIQITNVGSEN